MRTPETLGDVLAGASQRVLRKASPVRFVLNIGVLCGLTLVPLWWGMTQPRDSEILGGLWVALLVIWAVIAWWGRPQRQARPAQHFLIEHDQHGFMAGLRLDEKTAVFDGNNIYHFGLGEGIGSRALQLLAGRLRAEGYRVVCFFDANIFYTLQENGAFQDGQRHTANILRAAFGLREDEIYTVPSDVQADRFILSALKHLPVSFAVTNDRFRDYGKTYGDVMKGDGWRKGVVVTNGELRLLQFRMTPPIRLGDLGSG